LGELLDKEMVLTTPEPHIGDPEDRCEPIVIGLFGEPACGKTTFVQKLIAELQSKLFSTFNLLDVSYSRSCSMKHWDGYKGQPIVVLDDFGQSSDRLDVVEFQQLVSCNPYQLPMASLDDKGILFNSPVIILTSNMKFGSSLSTSNTPDPIEDNKAFWRRVHLPLILGISKGPRGKVVLPQDTLIFTDSLSHCLTTEEKSDFSTSISNSMEDGKTPFSPCCSSEVRNSMNQNTPIARSRRPASDPVDLFCYKEFPRKNVVHLIKRMVLNHHEFFLQKTSKFWVQEVSSENLSCIQYDSGVQIDRVVPLNGNNHSVFYRFPRSPPKGEPLPVRVEPIKEPLKVRTITAGMAETRCLKPLQQSMWDYLGTRKQFKLTHGTKYLEDSVWNCRSIEQSDPKLQEGLDNLLRDNPDSNRVWISGDYTSATDNFILECGSVILQEALQYIDHNPTKEWAMKEMSSHLLVYPRTSGISPGIQRNGQLMGSLLSFPLLCLVNDSTASLSGAKDSEYLINGDDILMRVKPEIGAKWKQIAPRLGLSLSIGKTFIDSEFGTVNSQLFFNGTLVPTGKMKTANRRTHILGETYRDFQRFHASKDYSNLEHLHKIFLRLNRPQLTKTFESLGVDISHGGLGLVTLPSGSKNRRKQDFLVYLTKLMKKFRPLKGSLKLPYIALSNDYRDSRISDVLQIPEEVKWEEGCTKAELCRTLLKSQRNPKFREVMDSVVNGDIDLQDLPDLDFIQIREVYYTKENYRDTQESIMNRFLSNLLDLETVILNTESKELLEHFRCQKKQKLQDSLGVRSDPIEIPESSLLHDTIVPVLLSCERLWSELLGGDPDSLLKEFGGLPESVRDSPFKRKIPEIDSEEKTHEVEFISNSITEWDVYPTIFTNAPEFEDSEVTSLSSNYFERPNIYCESCSST
jgi:hypothetical protein